jgi:hypothetical protein
MKRDEARRIAANFCARRQARCGGRLGAVSDRFNRTFGCRSGERVTPRRAVAALVVLGRDESDGVLKRH